MPKSIRDHAPTGNSWLIMPAGIAKYSVRTAVFTTFERKVRLAETKVPDATPGMFAKYALNDEQVLLVRVRFNRPIDIITGVAYYSLQNHQRTMAEGLEQIETDEIYSGVDRHGAHYVFPVKAKGGNDKLSVVQIAQDFEMSARKFPLLKARPVAAQVASGGLVVLYEFERTGVEVAVKREVHFKLASPALISPQDLYLYQPRVPVVQRQET